MLVHNFNSIMIHLYLVIGRIRSDLHVIYHIILAIGTILSAFSYEDVIYLQTNDIGFEGTHRVITFFGELYFSKKASA